MNKIIHKLKHSAWTIPILLILATQTLYLLTLHRSIPPLDSGDFIAAAAVKGVAHAPGYPLLTLINILFSSLPIFNLAIKINYVSAFMGTVSVLLFYYLALIITKCRISSLLAAWTLAVSSIFWFHSVIAEVFALNTSIAIGILYFVVKIREKYSYRSIFLISILFGLGFSHLHTIIFLLPAVLWMLVKHKKEYKYYQISIFFLAGILIGLLPYIYLPVAASFDPPLNFGDPDSFDRLLDVFLRKSYGTFSLSQYSGGSWIINLIGQLGVLLKKTIFDLKFLGGIPILVGCYALWKEYRDIFIMSVLYIIFGVVVFLALANSPTEAIFIRVLEKQYGIYLIILMILFSVGIKFITERLYQNKKYYIFSLILLFVIPLGMTISNFKHNDKSQDSYAYDIGKSILDSVEKDAIVFNCYDTTYYVVKYLQNVEDIKPDVIFLNFQASYFDAKYVRKLLLSEILLPENSIGIPFSKSIIRTMLDKRPIYFTLAGQCNGKDILGNLREKLVPMGVVYKLVEERNQETIEQLISPVIDKYNLTSEVTKLRKKAHKDFGIREIIGWYSDSYYNLSVMLRLLGRDMEANSYVMMAQQISGDN